MLSALPLLYHRKSGTMAAWSILNTCYSENATPVNLANYVNNLLFQKDITPCSIARYKMQNSFRIIAGTWRSRKLTFPGTVETLRPTKDRIRVTLFNWLQQKIIAANCLDLFAGSGALSFEALSRQAKTVTAIDKASEATRAMTDNCKLLECNNMEVITADAMHWLEQGAGQLQFDIVFLDPPFGENLLEDCCALLDSGNFLAPGALVYLESASSLEEINLPSRWNLLKHKKAGQVHFGVCEHIIL